MRRAAIGLFAGCLLAVLPIELAAFAVLVSFLRPRAMLLAAPFALTILIAAYHAPLKYLDRTVGPLPRVTTVRELAAHEGMMIDSSLIDRTIVLPRERLTRRELANEIARQTNTELRVSYCGVGATILGGGVPIGGLRFIKGAGAAGSRRS